MAVVGLLGPRREIERRLTFGAGEKVEGVVAHGLQRLATQARETPTGKSIRSRSGASAAKMAPRRAFDTGPESWFSLLRLRGGRRRIAVRAARIGANRNVLKKVSRRSS